MFRHIGSFAARYPLAICAVWLMLGVTLAFVAPSWDKRAQDDDIRFLPDRCASVRGYRMLEKAFPQDVFASRAIFAIERPDAKLSDDDLALVDDIVNDLKKLGEDESALQIKKIYSQRDPFIGKRLLSDDGQCTLIQVSLGTPYLALQTRVTVDRADAVVRDKVNASGIKGLDIYTTGPAGVGRDLVGASEKSLDKTTLATIILVVVILLLVYRSPLLALVPLVSIALAVWVAISILSLCTLIPGFVLVNISQIFAVVMLYGAGTDYCLFLISRYREELASGHTGRDAIGRSVGDVGGALAASAATVICGLGFMATTEFAKVRCGGPAIGVSLAVALLSSLTLTPALLSLLGKAVFWPMGAPRVMRPTQPENEGIWGWISHLVVAHPIAILAVSVSLLVPLAFLGLRVKPTYRATAELSKQSSSVSGLAAIQRHFTAGEVGPVTVLLQSEQPWDSYEGKRLIDHLSRGFSGLPNVAEVRSLTQPLGKPIEEPAPAPKPKKKGLFSAVFKSVVKNVQGRINKAANTVYVSRIGGKNGEQVRYVTRLDVVMKTDPFDPRSNDTLEVIQTWLSEQLPEKVDGLGELRTETYGVAVSARDMALVTESDRTRINGMVIVGIFLILLLLVRRPGLAAYLLVTVLLSYYATLGATAIMAHWCHDRPLGEVDWRVPFFLFTILVAVGEDYNILLIHRALEERKKHGGREGIRRALAHTGGTITSCGLIMAGTFATLMLAGLNTLVQVGFALAFGVMLDTFIVRPLMVPAFTLWLWNDEAPKATEKRRAA